MSTPLIKSFIEENADKIYQYPPLPAGSHEFQGNWIFNRSHAPWLELQGLDIPYKEMLAEAQALRDMFVEHRADEEHHRGWKSLAVHGISATQTNVAETYGLDSKTAKYDWTEIQDQCPATVKFLKDIMPYHHYARVRFMLLEAGGYIVPHVDNTQSFLGGAVNVSLNNPEGCKLVTEHGTLPFRDSGSAFYFNNHYRHCVFNDSTTDRFHMIIHGGCHMHLLAPLLVNSYKTQENTKTQMPLVC